ncbi:hypothetical protein ACLOJK_031086 [Asimina triloba]
MLASSRRTPSLRGRRSREEVEDEANGDGEEDPRDPPQCFGKKRPEQQSHGQHCKKQSREIEHSSDVGVEAADHGSYGYEVEGSGTDDRKEQENMGWRSKKVVPSSPPLIMWPGELTAIRPTTIVDPMATIAIIASTDGCVLFR